MVEMRVREEHGIQGLRVERERDAVPDRLVRAPLEHPAIDEDGGPFGRQQELRPGHGGRAAEEVDLHRAMVTGATGAGVSSGPWDPAST